ncbi:MAG: hypothetical protein R3A49_09675 [Acidimicrobiia bacterium]
MGRVRYDEPVRPFGRYGWQTINGFLENEPSFGFAGRPLHGMQLQTQWLYGSFKADDSDTYYAAIKHYNPVSSLALLLYKAEPGGDFEFVKEGSRAYRGGCFGGERAGRWGVWDIVSGPDDQRFTLNVGEDGDTHWRDRGLLDVSGEQRGNLMQSVVLDAESPMAYTSRCVRASGDVMGDPVEGFFFQDFHHLAPGQDWFITEFFHGVQGIWVVGATEYEDGGWDVTNFFKGVDGFASVLVQRSSGERLAATDLEVEVDVDDEGFVSSARFLVDDDQTWQWAPRNDDGTPRMPPQALPGAPAWNEGVVTRVGENRPWAHSEAWMEIYQPTLEKIT